MSRLVIVLAGLLAWTAIASAQKVRRPWIDPIDVPPVVQTVPDPAASGSIEVAPEVQRYEAPLVETRMQPNGCSTRSYFVSPGKEVRVHAC